MYFYQVKYLQKYWDLDLRVVCTVKVDRVQFDFWLTKNICSLSCISPKFSLNSNGYSFLPTPSLDTGGQNNCGYFYHPNGFVFFKKFLHKSILF